MNDARRGEAHALIIEDNMIVSRAIEDQLLVAGFRSVDHARTRRRAMELAGAHFPDLVVVGEHVDRWAGLEAARELGQSGRASVMMVCTNPKYCRKNLPDDILEGPYRIDQLSQAFNASRPMAASLN